MSITLTPDCEQVSLTAYQTWRIKGRLEGLEETSLLLAPPFVTLHTGDNTRSLTLGLILCDSSLEWKLPEGRSQYNTQLP
jgi:hypothetical protein